MNDRILIAIVAFSFISSLGAQPHDAIKAYAASSLRAPKDFVSLTKGGLPFIDVINQSAALINPEDSSQELKIIALCVQQGRKAVPRNILKDALLQATHIILKNIAKLAPATTQTLLEKLNSCLKYFGIEPITLPATPPAESLTPSVVTSTIPTLSDSGLVQSTQTECSAFRSYPFETILRIPQGERLVSV